MGTLRRLAFLVGVWTVPFAIGAGGHFFGIAMDGETMPASHILGHSAAWWYFWVPATPLVLWLGRRFPPRRGAWSPWLPVHLVASTALFVLQALLIIVVSRSVGHYLSSTPLLRAMGNAVVNQYLFSLATYAAILGVDLALTLARRQRDRDVAASQLEAQLAQAQLQALRTQLQPHFLFNALNTIVMLVRGGAREEATRVILEFSELMRLLLADGDRSTNTLAREVEFARRYLEIEQIRLGHRLAFDLDVTGAADDAVIPTLLLQPLVENAIRHGIAPKADGGRLWVMAGVEGDRLRITVEDDGVGVPAGWSRAGAPGVGLANTAGRLQRMYGRDHRFDVRPRAGGGVAVAIELPFTAARAARPVEAA